jgi:hypothetical protein
MRKRRWEVEWRARARSDGLDRLGRMVQLVIDRAGAHCNEEPTTGAARATEDDMDDEQPLEETQR